MKNYLINFKTINHRLRVHDGVMTGSYYNVTMGLVYDNYMILIPYLSFRLSISKEH